MLVEFSQLREDRALAGRVASGDEQAFEQFFREYFPRLFRFTLSRCGGDRVLSEEIVQATMCRVVRKMRSYRGEALLFTWLCQICRNEMAAAYRRQGLSEDRIQLPEDHPAVRAALESLSAEMDTPEDEHSREELARFVRLTLEYLPAKYATALEMKYLRGCTVEEIGKQLDISSKAAESVLSRARVAFKEGFRSLCEFEPELLLNR